MWRAECVCVYERTTWHRRSRVCPHLVNTCDEAISRLVVEVAGTPHHQGHNQHNQHPPYNPTYQSTPTGKGEGLSTTAESAPGHALTHRGVCWLRGAGVSSSSTHVPFTSCCPVTQLKHSTRIVSPAPVSTGPRTSINLAWGSNRQMVSGP